MNDRWDNASSYESYVGRWSRLVAPEFLKWLNQPKDLVWLDVGCGTGALSGTILELNHPRQLTGIDPAERYIGFAQEHFKNDARVSFRVGNAQSLNIDGNSIDVVVSGLVLNFIEDVNKALAEFKRVCRSGAVIGAYVWDYAGKMEMMRHFWDAAVSLFKDAREKDEGVRFPICNPRVLTQLFQSAGLHNIETAFIDVPTEFKNFADFWEPFLSGQAPAPGYCRSLSEEARQTLKEMIYQSLPIEKDGSIHLIARAIAVKAVKE